VSGFYWDARKDTNPLIHLWRYYMPNVIHVITSLIAWVCIFNEEIKWLSFVGKLLLTIIAINDRKITR
jgi:hypothetical protein